MEFWAVFVARSFCVVSELTCQLDVQDRFGASRKTALLIFFVFKEAGPFGAFAMLILLGGLFAVCYPFVLMVVTAVSATMKAPLHETHFRSTVWIVVEEIWGEATNAVWALSIGMSNRCACVCICMFLKVYVHVIALNVCFAFSNWDAGPFASISVRVPTFSCCAIVAHVICQFPWLGHPAQGSFPKAD